MNDAIKLTISMPRLGETMEEGTIAAWLIEPGNSFKRGDPLVEVETDKTLVEYPALGDGTLIETLVTQGDVVEVGTPIAVIETADAWDGGQGADIPDQTPMVEEHEPEKQIIARRKSDSLRPRATPLARRIAYQSGIDLIKITGSGRRGRIEADDVRAEISGIGARTRSLPRKTGAYYFVHGFAGLGSNWAALRAHLQRAGVTTKAPDLPGHGNNEAEAPNVDALLDWLVQDLTNLSEPVHLIGHSLGGYLAAQAALRERSRVSRLTLITPAGCGLNINGAFTSGMAHAQSAGEVAHLMRLLGRKAEALDVQDMTAGLQGARLSGLADDIARGDVQRIDTIAPLRTLAGDLPTTAIFGLNDQIIPRSQVFNMPPWVACHMVDAGHMPHWDASETVAAIMTGP
ncbi:acetoin dehydrogenase dihydrolipoyllysine-residue acetyltransferase subunit [Tateyamaria omphalii]|uniref:acetoin dehydrogenase dihydrolipoyllysine-residue acetyltransferase subunit n=1 Tax=Tateyamaria omphalii TaxID=299262 RepID=UPI001C994EE1|nr:acetoin dehydrogenase dihydrolipoyllysine-residue acetyltransferase subunit [Tateyamaria omphalii]MBY5934917.1 acetoin dehydrogenase dihydrolipoyllysine-residue acetyltransferase subunit [Tateyamaria omphalii]